MARLDEQGVINLVRAALNQGVADYKAAYYKYLIAEEAHKRIVRECLTGEAVERLTRKLNDAKIALSAEESFFQSALWCSVVPGLPEGYIAKIQKQTRAEYALGRRSRLQTNSTFPLLAKDDGEPRKICMTCKRILADGWKFARCPDCLERRRKNDRERRARLREVIK